MSKVKQIRRPIDDEYLEEIATICANASRKTFKQISEDMGFEGNYIYTLRRRYPQLITMTDEKIKSRFKEMSADGTHKLYELMMNAESESVQLNAAKEILSRAGYDAVQKTETTNKEIIVEIED